MPLENPYMHHVDTVWTFQIWQGYDYDLQNDNVILTYSLKEYRGKSLIFRRDVWENVWNEYIFWSWVVTIPFTFKTIEAAKNFIHKTLQTVDNS